MSNKANEDNTDKSLNRCYARALPTDGSHGGQGWGSTRGTAENNALAACRKYSRQTGGDPNTCRIVESHCNSNVSTSARLLPDEPMNTD
jgi:hypothetical protein